MTVWRRVALVLIRLHPPAWRRRYADEVSALVEQSPASLRSAVDLAGSGVAQWMRASWGSVVIEPGRWPHPGRLVGLWLLTAFAFYLGASTARLLEVAYYAGLVASYGMTDRAIEILTFQSDGLRRLGPPPLQLEMIPEVLVGMYLWCGLPATPVIVAARLSGLGRQFPVATRFAVVAAFSALSIWLLGLPAISGISGTLVAGWVLACGFFPRRPSAGHGATSIPTVNA